MTAFSLRSLNVVCIVGYLLFMGIAIDSSIVDALVFYVTEQEGQPTLVEGTTSIRALVGSSKLVALQFRSHPARGTLARASKKKKSLMLRLPIPSTVHKATSESASMVMTRVSSPAVRVSTCKSPLKRQSSVSGKGSAQAPAKSVSDFSMLTVSKPAKTSIVTKKAVASLSKRLSILSLLKMLDKKRWSFNSTLNRYVVKYDKDTTVVLTLRPSLQKELEKTFKRFSCRIGAGVIQDPRTGAVLALASYERNKILSVTTKKFVSSNHALKANYPIASIFKIITAASGLDKKKITVKSRFKAWKRYYLEVWQAFAKSHNGVFGKIGRKVGRKTLQAYANAFGFNKPFYFDLPVEKSVAKLPSNSLKLSQAAAGLNNNFQVSPIHVASIVSTILNKGRQMKPYLVDYVLHKNKVVFRRKPFPLAQPIAKKTARQLYRIMHITTTKGTARKGFKGYSACPNLAKLSGGKTGTLTGKSPRYLFTWFGGFTKTSGRELTIVTLVGQKGRHHTKASTVAGRLAYQLALKRGHRKHRKKTMLASLKK